MGNKETYSVRESRFATLSDIHLRCLNGNLLQKTIHDSDSYHFFVRNISFLLCKIFFLMHNCCPEVIFQN